MFTRMFHTSLTSSLLRSTFALSALVFASSLTACGESDAVTGSLSDADLEEAVEVDAQKAGELDVKGIVAQVSRARAADGTSSLICPPGDPRCVGIGGGGDENIHDPFVEKIDDITIIVYEEVELGTLTTIGVRVDASGHVLDEKGFVIGSSTFGTGAPQVFGVTMASNGTSGLVVFQSLQDGNADLMAARLDGKGNLVEASTFTVAGGFGIQTAPALAFDGANYVLAYTDDQSGSSDVLVRRISPDGVVLDRRPLALAYGAGYQGAPAIAAACGGVMVAYEQGESTGASTNIYGRTLTSGLLGTPVAIASATGAQLSPAIASNGSRYQVAWEDHRSTAGADIYSRQVECTGFGRLEVQLTSAGLDQGLPAVTFNGAGFTAAWTSEASDGSIEIRGTLLDAAGNLAGETNRLFGGDVISGTGPALTGNASGATLVWAAQSSTGDAVYSTVIH